MFDDFLRKLSKETDWNSRRFGIDDTIKEIPLLAFEKHSVDAETIDEIAQDHGLKVLLTDDQMLIMEKSVIKTIKQAKETNL